jgi:hypothetical protein
MDTDPANRRFQYELYNLKSDPLQLKNSLYGVPGSDVGEECARLTKLLTSRFNETGKLPDSFAWPIGPASG